MTPERRQQLQAKITHAQSALTDLGETVSADPAESPLAKRIGAAVGAAITAAFVKHAEGADTVPMRKAATIKRDNVKLAPGDIPRTAVDEAYERVRAIIGDDDPEKVASAITAALALPLAVDMHASPEVAALLAKAVASVPQPGVPDVGVAERDFAERVRHLEFLAEHAGGVPDAKLREVRSDAEAIAAAKTLRPTVAAPPVPRPDRRAAIREELARATADGLHPTILEHLRAELQEEEVRAIVARPNGRVTPWGGVSRSLAPPA